jgi:hypothetical protein
MSSDTQAPPAPTRVRCAYCAKPLTASNRAVSYPLYFGMSYPMRIVHGCQWCQGHDSAASQGAA